MLGSPQYIKERAVNWNSMSQTVFKKNKILKKKPSTAISLFFQKNFLAQCSTTLIFLRIKNRGLTSGTLQQYPSFKTVHWFTICGASLPLELTIGWSESQLLLSRSNELSFLIVETFCQFWTSLLPSMRGIIFV